MTLYGSNGQINTTSVSGSSYTGLYATDGSYNVVVNASSTYVGLHHACGAYNAVVVTDPSSNYYASNGSMNVIANSSSPSGFSPVQPIGINTVPSWVLAGASVDMDFANNRFFGGTTSNLLSITRASNATDLLPSSTSGYVYNIYSSNVLSISPTFGLLIFEARTNLLLNSTVPATQTTASLGTGSYTLWVNGSGSALASGNTATITGAASATNGSSNTFTVTVAGTVTVTVTGSLNAFQLEAGGFGTSFIVTAGATATRASDNIQAAGALSSALLGAQGTVLFSGTAAGVNAGTNYLLGPGANNGFLMAASNLSGANGGSAIQGVANLCVAGGGFTANVAHKMIGSWLQSNYGLSLDGAATVTSGNGSTLTQTGPESIGNRLGGQFFNGRLLRLTAWNAQLSNALLPGLST